MKQTYGMKRKDTAVILSFLFAHFTWLYTYREDAWKFWLNLLAVLGTGGLWLLIAWPWALFDASGKEESWYDNYHKGASK